MQKISHSVNNGRIGHLTVKPRPGSRTGGLLIADDRIIHCALGRSGIGIKRGEGDGITPVGSFRLIDGFYRRDRLGPLSCPIGLQEIRFDDGWCDSVGDRNYNLPVKLPYRASHEKMFRTDHLYDIVLVMDFNITKRITRGGSAIFFHLAHDDYRTTEGCIAVARKDMEWLLPRINTTTTLKIAAR